MPTFVSLWLLSFFAHTLCWPTLWKSTSLSSKFTKWVMCMAAVVIQYNLLKTLSNWISIRNSWFCKYLKPYFRVICLFPWIMKVYTIYRCVYIYIYMYTKLPCWFGAGTTWRFCYAIIQVLIIRQSQFVAAMEALHCTIYRCWAHRVNIM